MDRRDYPPRPIIGVGAVVWDGAKVLLIRRALPPAAGQWSIPGGALELGETIEQGARREVLEETGIRLGPVEFLGVVELIRRDATQAVQYHYLLVDVMAEATTTELSSCPEVIEARWADPEDLADLGLWSETLRMIELAAERRVAIAKAGRSA
jgi:8-oxo-dGTP diphosphatase